MVFGFMTKVTNYMEGCYSKEMVPERYYQRIVLDFCKNYKRVRDRGMGQEFISKIALNNLIEVTVKLDMNLIQIDNLVEDMMKSPYRQQFICSFIKHDIYLSSIGKLTDRDLIKID